MQLIWDQIQSFVPDIDSEGAYGQAWFKGMSALGRAQEEDGMAAFKEATDAFLKVYEQHPERPEALMGVTYLLVLLGDELTAVHYARSLLEHSPDFVPAQELLSLLESSSRLNSLLEDVERLFHHVGLREERSEEVLSDGDSQRLVGQTEQLLLLQHGLLVIELNQGLFKRLEQLNSRQRSLETLFDMLSAHLTHFLEDQKFGDRLRTRLDVLAFDLESLQNLENLFDAQRIFQKEVQTLFRDLTRHTIQLRMRKRSGLDESRAYHRQLESDIHELGQRLEAYPAILRNQVESASGWNHLKQQSQQLHELIESTAQA